MNRRFLLLFAATITFVALTARAGEGALASGGTLATAGVLVLAGLATVGLVALIRLVYIDGRSRADRADGRRP